MGQLEEQIKVVVVVRERAQEAKIIVKEAKDAWETGNSEILADVASSSASVIEAEAKLRDLTLQAYAETGDKHPAKGVDINLTTIYKYDPDDALKWAIEHKMALKLDETKFKNHVKADPPDFVTVFTNIPKATIATKLEVE